LDLLGPQVAIVSTQSLERRELGYLNELYLSPKYMFVTYSEEAFYSSRPNEVESNIISIFSRDGAFELGIREFLDKDRDAWKFEEVTAGYTFKDKFSFVASDSPLLWILNVSERSWRKFPAPDSLASADVLTGDDKTAYAIFDHRNLLRHYPDRPPFELAVFNLLSETSSKQDFAPIETELLASGFEMSEIKFRPSSTGKIIVSDGKKAALLEFSDSA
jgi:hypothetical protein